MGRHHGKYDWATPSEPNFALVIELSFYQSQEDRVDDEETAGNATDR